MELVTHTCGAQLWRQETGGVQKVVTYAHLDDQRETHDCPGCSLNLRDSDLTDEDGEPVLSAPYI